MLFLILLLHQLFNKRFLLLGLLHHSLKIPIKFLMTLPLDFTKLMYFLLKLVHILYRALCLVSPTVTQFTLVPRAYQLLTLKLFPRIGKTYPAV